MSDNPLTLWLFPLILKLAKKAEGPPTSTFNLNSTKNILLLYKLDNNIHRDTVKEFITAFEAKGIHVSSVEFIESGKTEFVELKEKNHFNLTKENLNFWSLPKKSFSKKVFPKPFDLVINFSLQSILPFHFITHISSANLKIGFLDGPYLNCYDFIINPEGNKNLREHKDEILKYLDKINKS